MSEESGGVHGVMKVFLPFQPIPGIWAEEDETLLEMPVSECETECSIGEEWSAP